MLEALFQDVIQRMFVGLNEFANFKAGVSTERRDVLSSNMSMVERLRRLVAKPLHDGDSVMAKDHQRVVRISNDSRELGFQNLVELIDNFICFHEDPP